MFLSFSIFHPFFSHIKFRPARAYLYLALFSDQFEKKDGKFNNKKMKGPEEKQKQDRAEAGAVPVKVWTPISPILVYT